MESVDQEIANNEPPKLEVGAGQLLADARKKQNKSLEDIAQVLNLSVTQLRAIEQDKSEGLPEPTYVRGYIRGYAMLLGLDVDEVVRHYQGSQWDQSANLDRLPRGVSDTTNNSQQKFTKPFRWLLLMAIFALLGYLFATGKAAEWLGITNKPEQVLALDQQDLNSFDLDTASNLDNRVGEDGADFSQGSASEDGIVTQEDSATQVEQNNITSEDGDANAESQTPIAPSEGGAGELTSAATEANSIEIKFLDTSWIDIRDTNDNRLAYKSYAKGETLSLSSDLPLNVFIGNASGVDVTYNDESFDISDYQQGVYAKFRLGATD